MHFPVLGTLPSSEGVIFTVPNGQVMELNWISVQNEHSTTITCQLFVAVNGQQSALTPEYTLTANHGVQETAPLILHQGTTLRGVASVASVAEYIISGRVL